MDTHEEPTPIYLTLERAALIQYCAELTREHARAEADRDVERRAMMEVHGRLERRAVDAEEKARSAPRDPAIHEQLVLLRQRLKEQTIDERFTSNVQRVMQAIVQGTVSKLRDGVCAALGIDQLSVEDDNLDAYIIASLEGLRAEHAELHNVLDVASPLTRHKKLTVRITKLVAERDELRKQLIDSRTEVERLWQRPPPTPASHDMFQMTISRRRDNSDWPEWLHRAWNGERDVVGTVQRVVPLGPSDADPIEVVLGSGKQRIEWGDWIVRHPAGGLYVIHHEVGG